MRTLRSFSIFSFFAAGRAFLGLLVLVLCASCGSGEPAGAGPAGGRGELQAGFARADITPSGSVKMAGYGTYFLSEDLCRWSTGVHDPLYATAVAFETAGQAPVVLIHLDVIGVIVTDTVRIRQGVAQELGVSVDRVLVAASHSHGSPDTVGIWGLILPPSTGRDEAFIERMIAGAVEAGVAAWRARVPAVLGAATGEERRMHYNPQATVDAEAVTDDTLTLLAVHDLQGRLLGTLMNWGCHPMVMGPQNTLITADYPGAYTRILASELGGVHLVLNGAQGGTVHPQNPDHPFPIQGDAWGTWEDVERFGRVLAEDVKGLLARAEPLARVDAHLESWVVRGELENPFFVLAGELGIIPRDMPPVGGVGETLASAFSLGEVRFATVPGELVPTLGLQARTLMGGKHRFLINLGMDWMGYILTAEQYRNPAYIYFSILSVGPHAGETLLQEYRQVFESWPGS